LQTNIGEGGYPILNIDVSLDGVPIGNKSKATPTSAPAKNSTTTSQLGATSPAVIGGIAAAGVLCLILGFVLFLQRRRRRERLENGEKGLDVSRESDDSSDSPSPRMSNLTSRKRSKTNRTGSAAPPVPEPEEDVEDVSLSGIISTDDSLFISVDGGRSPSVSERSYDLSRLDMVISNAKKEWTPDEAPETPKQSNMGNR
jgi:hypothetical protein